MESKFSDGENITLQEDLVTWINRDVGMHYVVRVFPPLCILILMEECIRLAFC